MISDYKGSGKERVLTYSGQKDVSYRVDLGRGHTVDFTPVIRHPRFRRLKEIGQLSPVDLVINDADHKRYTHVLGAFSIGKDIVARSILYPDEVKMSESDRFVFLSLCLLHDIGHGPYSHVYEILAEAYGLPNHKQIGIKVIREEFREALRDAAGENNFDRVDLTEEIASEMEEKGPLARLVCDKDRVDKLDYVFRDAYHCGIGPRPDITTIVQNIVFDGNRSGVKKKAENALMGFIDALVTNNKDIYLLGEVEIVEGFLIRAICNRINNAFAETQELSVIKRLDPLEGYFMTDSELDVDLQRNPVSQRLLGAIRSRDASDWVAVAYIKPERCSEAASTEMERTEVEKGEALIEEVSDDELKEVGEKIKLPKLLPFEIGARKELGLKPEEFEVTSSPQIDRLVIQECNTASRENGEYSFKNILDPKEPLAAVLSRRMREHHAIRVVTTREKAAKVLDYVKANGGPKKLLMSIGQ